MDHDRLTVAYELLDFEASHDTLHALIIIRMVPDHFRHVVAVFFLNIGAHLALHLGNIVEYCSDRAGQIRSELIPLLLDEDGADVVSVAGEYRINVEGRVGTDNLETLQHIELCHSLYAAIDEELVQACGYYKQVLVHDLVGQNGADLLDTSVCNVELE